MSDATAEAMQGNAAQETEPAKRTQILAGALRVFRGRGYDGASMETIAREAGVSKGTLYVYFSNKEELFKALILSERHDQAESTLSGDPTSADLAEDLGNIGRAYVRKMTQPEKLSTLRMVIGAAETFPEFGELLYDEGPKKGTALLAKRLEHFMSEGQIKEDCDVEMAAGQFFSLCVASCFRRAIFNVAPPPDGKEIDRHVKSAVDVFMAAYGA